MAFELVVHQSLHGYSDGHRMLASSLPSSLKGKDTRSMLIMSDATGTSGVEDNGYLTGYPLLDSGYYALARTWGAPEMKRPGCVWTHTLLIDFEQLFHLDSLESLLGLHKHPRTKGAEKKILRYDRELRFAFPDSSLDSSAFVHKNIDSLKQILFSLYSIPESSASWISSESAERICMLIWSQQWNCLRKQFSFCTFSASERTSGSKPFDLYFLPKKDPLTRIRLSKALPPDELDAPEVREWMNVALQDLGSIHFSLQNSIRELAREITLGREVFVPLCKFYNASTETNSKFDEAIDKMISLLAESFPEQATYQMKKIIMAFILDYLPIVSSPALEFGLKNLDLISSENQASFGKKLWLRDPAKFVSLLNETDVHKQLAKEGLAELDDDELINGCSHLPDNIDAIASQVPRILKFSTIWKTKGSWEKHALANALKDDAIQLDVLKAILQSNRTDLFQNIEQLAGGYKMLEALDLCSFEGQEILPSNSIKQWLMCALTNDDDLSNFLKAKNFVSRLILFQIAQNTHPDDLSDYSTIDPWLHAIRSKTNELPPAQAEYLATYLLTRAFGNRSQNPAELIAETLDTVYFAAWSSRLSHENWSMIVPRLPRPRFLQDWDRCDQLREGIADIFLQRSFSPSIFAHVTEDISLFTELSKIIVSRGKRGKFFIEDVRKSLRPSHQDKDLLKLRRIERIR